MDMDRLVTDAEVVEERLPNGVRAQATGDPATLESLRGMVPAHAAELARDARWTVRAEEDAQGVSLTVTSEDPAAVARIQVWASTA